MDLMKTVAENSMNTVSPKEQLHALNEQKKQDLENSLLKEALIVSSERCEKSLTESNHLLQESEKKRKADLQILDERIIRIHSEMQAIQTANELLKGCFEKNIESLSGDLRTDIVKAVQDDLNQHTETFKHQIDRLTRHAEAIAKNLNAAASKVKHAEDMLFLFEGGKRALFWIGELVNILIAILLLWQLLN